jgi:hypothetical protein
MADVPVEVKKAAPAETTTPDVWRSFRGEMDRLFDRFGFPSLRHMFDMEPGVAVCELLHVLGAGDRYERRRKGL